MIGLGLIWLIVDRVRVDRVRIDRVRINRVSVDRGRGGGEGREPIS